MRWLQVEAARLRAAKNKAAADRARQNLEKSQTDTTAERMRQIEGKERQVSANLNAKAEAHEASVKASAEAERLLSIRRESVHRSREDKDARIAQELLAKAQKLKEQKHELEVRKQQALAEKDAMRLRRRVISEEKRQRMQAEAEHRAAGMRDFHEAVEAREAKRKAAIGQLITSRRLATTAMADMQSAAQASLARASPFPPTLPSLPRSHRHS